jgi:hypothetical protein
MSGVAREVTYVPTDGAIERAPSDQIQRVAEDIVAIYTLLGEVIRVLDVADVLRQWRRRVVIVVARDAQPHYDYLAKAFAGVPCAEVIVDRRRGERRARDRGRPLDPRHRDRRQRHDAEERLRTAPWAVVCV